MTECHRSFSFLNLGNGFFSLFVLRNLGHENDKEGKSEDAQGGVHQREHVADFSLHYARDEQSRDDDDGCAAK